MTNELKKILESSVLTDEVKAELKEAFESQVTAQVTEREVKLAEALEAKKAELATTAVEMIEEAVTEEFKAIQDEITEARSLDVRYAIKLEEFKEQFAEAKSKELAEQVQTILSEEMSELKESLVEARNNIAGQRMFEAFQSTYGNLVNEGVEDDSKEKLEEAQKELAEFRREKKLDDVLSGVTGRKRTIMETLLEGVAIEKLESRFADLSKNILLNESEGEEKEEKEESLEESVKEDDAPKGEVVFESDADQSDEDAEKRRQAWMKRARRMAGLD